MATVAVIGVISELHRFQCWVVPAGQGKSRIEHGVAFHFLKTGTHHVNLVYANKGLMERDMRDYAQFWSYLRAFSEKMAARLHYHDNIQNVDKSKKNVIIVDESDDVTFKDLEGFYNKICGANTRVVCLTATAHDGKEKGSERHALESLGFKIYHNSRTGKLEMPNCDITMDLSDNEVILAEVEKRKKDRGVLIFATEKLYEEL